MRRGSILGGEAFVERVLERIDGQKVSREVVRTERPAVSLETIAQQHPDRDLAIQQAYRSGAYTITEIAEFFGVHRSTASRIARR